MLRSGRTADDRTGTTGSGAETSSDDWARTAMTVLSSLGRFPLYPLRLLAVVLGWNVLLRIDDSVLDVSYFGPFSLFACASLAILCFTAPAWRYPGRWLVREQRFANRWRWLFWYLGALSSFFAGLVAYRIICRGFDIAPLL